MLGLEPSIAGLVLQCVTFVSSSVMRCDREFKLRCAQTSFRLLISCLLLQGAGDGCEVCHCHFFGSCVGSDAGFFKDCGYFRLWQR